MPKSNLIRSIEFGAALARLLKRAIKNMSRAELQESSISRLSSHYSKHPLIIIRELENLWGKGEQAKYKKNIRAREDYMKKENTSTPINPKNVHALA